jgi:hypothetical protein
MGARIQTNQITGRRAMKSIYEVTVGRARFLGEIWLFEAESLSAAVLKAESKIARGKRRYENWQVYKAVIVSGKLCR